MSTAAELGPGLGERSAPTAADRAVLRTVTYAALFRCPLTLARLHRLLMDVRLDEEALAERLDGPFLRSRLTVADGLVYPKGREAWLAEREERRRRSRGLLESHRRVLGLIAAFPFVRLAALSGGCAHENASDDDVDVFLVAKRGRAWTVALALMLLSKLLGVRRSLCLNYIVDEAAAALPENDVFTAAEIVGMRPLAGREGYALFLAANAWVAESHPNFFARIADEVASVPASRSPRRLEAVLDLAVAPLAEALSRRVLGAYLRRRLGSGTGVVLSPGRLKLHAVDHRPQLLALFDRALEGAERERQ